MNIINLKLYYNSALMSRQLLYDISIQTTHIQAFYNRLSMVKLYFPFASYLYIFKY